MSDLRDWDTPFGPSKEICKDSLYIQETRKENQGSFTSLEEAAEEYSNKNEYMDVGFCVEPVYIGHKTERAFIAGAEWQARQLLKGSPLPEDTVLFQKGVEEGKRLMMEEAVEGRISSKGLFVESVILDTDNFKLGDKVKIIVIKDERTD